MFWFGNTLTSVSLFSADCMISVTLSTVTHQQPLIFVYSVGVDSGEVMAPGDSRNQTSEDALSAAERLSSDRMP